MSKLGSRTYGKHSRVTHISGSTGVSRSMDGHDSKYRYKSPVLAACDRLEKQKVVE